MTAQHMPWRNSLNTTHTGRSRRSFVRRALARLCPLFIFPLAQIHNVSRVDLKEFLSQVHLLSAFA